MSLISDALRRARQDGGGTRQGRDRLPGPLGQPPRRPRPAMWVVILAAVLAAALGAGGVWLVVHRSGEGSRPGTTGMAAAAAPNSVAASPVNPAGFRGSSAGGAPAPRPSENTARLEGSQGPATPSPPSRSPVVEAPASPLPAPPRPVSDEARQVAFGPGSRHPARGSTPGGVSARGSGGDERVTAGSGEAAAGRTGTVHGEEAPSQDDRREKGLATGGSGTPGRGGASPRLREFVGEGTVDGVSLTLDYLVYRSQDPFAQINGMEVHVGSEVQGFKVVAVTENGVRLMGAGGPVLLKVR